jgi:hypothetical protein
MVKQTHYQAKLLAKIAQLGNTVQVSYPTTVTNGV